MGFFSNLFGKKELKKTDNEPVADGLTEPQKLYNLGLQYKKNNDLVKAKQSFLLAAEKGNERAQYELGFMYSQGIGFEQDYDKAIRYFLLSAEQEYVGAYGSLAYHYLNGIGVQCDQKKGVEYLILAAEKGDVGSQCNLGGLYFKTDINESLKWLGIAAENNKHPASFDAQFKLGCLYYSLSQGGLMPKQTFEAKKWFNIAANNGHKDAQNALEKHF